MSPGCSRSGGDSCSRPWTTTGASSNGEPTTRTRSWTSPRARSHWRMSAGSSAASRRRCTATRRRFASTGNSTAAAPATPRSATPWPSALRRIAYLQNQLNRRREALENCDRAIGLLEALVEDRPGNVRSRHNLALAVFTKAGIKDADQRIREAAALYERAASLQEEVVTRSEGAEGERASLALYTYTMSRSLANSGRAARGKDACLKAISLYEALMRDHPRAYKYRYGHAMALSDLAHLDAGRSGRWSDLCATRSRPGPNSPTSSATARTSQTCGRR